MQVKIKKGVALPVSRTKWESVFDAMQAGDSFFVEKSEARSRAVSEFSKWKRKNDSRKAFGFISRAVDGGYRCWMVAA